MEIHWKFNSIKKEKKEKDDEINEKLFFAENLIFKCISFT